METIKNRPYIRTIKHGGIIMATGYLEWKMMKNDMEADDVPGAYHFNEWYDEEQVW